MCFTTPTQSLPFTGSFFIFPPYTLRVGFPIPLCKVCFFLLPVERLDGTKRLRRCSSGFWGWCPPATYLLSQAHW